MPSNGIKSTSIQIEPIGIEKIKENSPSNIDDTPTKVELNHIETVKG